MLRPRRAGGMEATGREVQVSTKYAQEPSSYTSSCTALVM